MIVLWLCNVMLPMVAKQLNMESTNKEGWISGLAEVVLKNRSENGIELAIAFPAPKEMFPEEHDVCMRTVATENGKLTCYGFREDTLRPDVYDAALEERLRKILNAVKPDIVHCFGTEYPHTLAMCRIFPRKDRILLGIQGLCSVYANAYFANMPDKVIDTVTLRDRLKNDNLRMQQQKFAKRGAMEVEAIKLAGNVTGRTEWDRYYTKEWNPDVCYYNMNEILRSDFYEKEWNKENCKKHSIFVSQGDYPIKGLHYMLTALPIIKEKYSDVVVYVAGQDLTRYRTIKQKLKISGYGKYLRGLIKKNKIKNNVVFLGKLDSEQMRDQYLKCSLFVCPSSIENSPNSLGEAMLLGMPCVSADVGGIPSIFSAGEDGILYEGFRSTQNAFDNISNLKGKENMQLELISKRLAYAVIDMWSHNEKVDDFCRNARIHAKKTHNRERNYMKLNEIYSKIISGVRADSE